MRSLISRSKVNLAYFLFTRPLSVPLLPNMVTRVRVANKTFERQLDDQLMLKASQPFVAYSFNAASTRRALVVHGWMSKSAYMIRVIERLVLEGFHVVAIDLPGHGASPSGAISWQDSIDAILKTQTYFGAFELALGHSYGGAMILAATGAGRMDPRFKTLLAPKKMILLAAPTRVETPIKLFADKVRLNAQEIQALTRRIEQASEQNISTMDSLYLQMQFPTDTHIHCIHDENDRIIPFADAERLKQLGARVSVSRMQGLGHVGVIYAERSLDRISEFLAR